MKRVMLRDRGMFKAHEVLVGMIKAPTPERGISFQDMHGRMRLLTALERSHDRYVDLEDADHAVLVQILNTAQFVTATPELYAILNDIANAKAPEDTLQLKLIDDAV